MKRVNIGILFFCVLGIAAVLFCSGCTPQEGMSESVAKEAEEAGQLEEENTYQPQEIECQNGDKKIYGVLYQPKTEDRVPLIICSHGFALTHESLAFFGEDFREYGVAVYCFDFCGGSEESKSDGSMLDMSLMTNVSDLNAVLDMVKSWDFIDQNRIVLLGYSQGGAASAIVASQRNTEVAGLVLLAPAFNIPNIARERCQEYENGAMLPDTFDHMGHIVGRRYFEDVLQYDIYQDIRKYQNPVLLFQGTEDKSVPIWYSEYAARVYRNVEYIRLSGAEHNLMATHMGIISDYMWAFFEKLGFWG